MADDDQATDPAKWLTPRQVLMLVGNAMGSRHAAAGSILERLKVGLVHAAALTWRESGRELSRRPLVLSPNHWGYVGIDAFHAEADFWRGAELVLRLDRSPPYRTITLFDVRFAPAGIYQFDGVEQPSQPQVLTPEDPVKQDPDNSIKDTRKPVPPAALAKWAEAHFLAYGGTRDDKVNFAWDCAKGAFPRHKVTREAVRKLVGGNRKPGPKSGA